MLNSLDANKIKLIESIGDVVYKVAIPKGCFEYISSNAAKIFGYGPTFMLEENLLIHELIHPDFREIYSRIWQEMIEETIPSCIECKIKTKAGEYRWIMQSILPQFDERGDLVAIEGIIRDMTDIKRKKMEIEALNKRIEFILGATNTGLDIIDSNFNIIYVDEEWMKKYGDYKNQKCHEYFMGLTEPCKGCGIKKALKTKKPVVWEERLVKENNRPIMVNTIPFQDENGKWLFAEVNVDITERKKWEDQLIAKEELLNKLNKELEERVKERTKKLKKSEEEYRKAYSRAEFYKDIFTHDINNILQSILVSSELMNIKTNKKVQSPELTHFLDIINKQIERAKILTENVRKLSELDKDQNNLEEIEIVAMLKKSIETVKYSQAEKEIKIQLEPFKERIIVEANVLLQDVFENLLLNAINYNERDPTEITIKIEENERDDSQHLKFEFIDNGIGIEDTRKKEIFERGYNADRTKKGMGLGLSLVKKIISTYRGEIWVEDKVPGDFQKGSKFIFTLPIPKNSC